MFPIAVNRYHTGVVLSSVTDQNHQKNHTRSSVYGVLRVPQARDQRLIIIGVKKTKKSPAYRSQHCPFVPVFAVTWQKKKKKRANDSAEMRYQIVPGAASRGLRKLHIQA